MRLLLWMVVPMCKTCIHYIPPKQGDFDDLSLAKCKKIGSIDVVNGETEYSSAQSVREYACGEQGILYKPEPRLRLKEATHYFRTNRDTKSVFMVVMANIILILLSRR